MKAKKSYGQHFLNSEVISERIANSLLLTETYNDVLEVGPGQGMLTKYLLDKDYKLKVVEADKDMVAYLQTHYPHLAPNIIAKDFLKMRLEEEMGNNFALIGNFPYNISSQIIFKIIENKEYISEMCGMFQLEVAKRICEKSGSKVYGILSVLTQAFFETNFLFTVSKNLFYPVPNVESAVISLKRKENFDLECNELLFFRVVKLCFQQRRKKIRNGLKTLNLSNNLREDAIFDKRPEQLSVTDFIRLTCSIENDI